MFINPFLIFTMTKLATSTAIVDPTNVALNQLPELQNWPHRPVFLQAGTDTSVVGYSASEPLPVGVPFQFESSLFKGTILIRIRNVTSDDPGRNEAYFSGKKRLKQVVVQGQFKENIKVSDVFFGNVYDRTLKPAPPPSLSRMINAFMSRLVPGLILDLGSSKPKVLTLYAGCAHSLSVNLPGQEPNIMDDNLPENTVALLNGKDNISSDKRKKKLSKPKQASRYQFDTDHVYTFHNYDNVIDLGTYNIDFRFGQYDLTKTLNGQPMSISAITQDGRSLYSFRVWHERLLPSVMK